MSVKKDGGDELHNFAVISSLHCRPTNSIYRGIVHGKVNGGGKQLEVRSQVPEQSACRRTTLFSAGCISMVSFFSAEDDDAKFNAR